MHTFVPKIILLWKAEKHHQNVSVQSQDFACLQSQWHKSNKDWKNPAQAAAADDSTDHFQATELAWHTPLRRFGSH